MNVPSPPPKDRRRRLTRQFVPHPSYSWFMSRAIAGGLLLAMVLSLVLWLLHRQLLQRLLTSGAIESDAADLVQLATASLLRLSLLSLGLLVLGMALLNSYLLHRITGPIYRLAVDLREALLAPGKRISFRATDQCLDIAELVNELQELRAAREAQSVRSG